ncbi:MAG TPA: ABC transporter permease [Microlunatus sp.]|nr:ABC transporter permease [Microlunatus sp.]
MRAAVRSEWRKWTTTRLWWILLLSMAGYMAFIGATLALTYVLAPTLSPGMPALGGRDIAVAVYASGNGLGYVFPLLVGTLAMTGEYRYQTITPSLLVEPSRSVFLGAKVVVAFMLGLAFGIVGTAATVGTAAPILAWKGDGAFLGEWSVVRPVLLSVVALAFWTVIGVGIGSVITNQVLALVLVLGWTQFVEPLLRLGFGAVESLHGAARFLPAAASDALVGASTYSAMTSGLELLSRPIGALLFAAYGALLLLLGRFTTLRRDVT